MVDWGGNELVYNNGEKCEYNVMRMKMQSTDKIQRELSDQRWRERERGL